MMHLVIDARTITPHFPGIGRYVLNLLQTLPPLLRSDESLTILGSSETDVPSGMARAGVGKSLSPRQQWDIPRVLHHLHADIYHSPYFLMPYRPGVPAVLTIHDLIPLLHPKHVSLSARRLFPHLIRLALRATQHVITVSTATRDDLCQRLHVPPEHITVIHSAPDPRFRPQSDQAIMRLRARLGLSKPYVLYVGSNKPHKNLVRLIQSWAQVSRAPEGADWILAIAGPWDHRYHHALQRDMKQIPDGRVRVLGWIAEIDLPALYSGAGLFVFPSIYEGFGFPVLEAMACGAPVICSYTSSLSEVGGGATLYFAPWNAEEMTATIRGVLGDPERRAVLRSASLHQAAHFSWEKTARHTLDVYRKVANHVSQQFS